MPTNVSGGSVLCFVSKFHSVAILSLLRATVPSPINSSTFVLNKKANRALRVVQGAVHDPMARSAFSAFIVARYTIFGTSKPRVAAAIKSLHYAKAYFGSDSQLDQGTNAYPTK